MSAPRSEARRVVPPYPPPHLLHPVSHVPDDRELLRLIVTQMRRLAGPHRDFDDLVQKGWLEVNSALPRFRGEARLSTFVAAICYRVWSKHLRWSSRFFRRFLTSSDGCLPELADGRDPAPLTLERREEWRHLYAALDRITEKRRTVVILHDLQGLELEEIAGIVECGVTTVRTRLRDGRKALAEALREDPYFSKETEA